MKSGNVLVIGDFKMVKICDFGVALRLDENLVVAAEDEVISGWNTSMWHAHVLGQHYGNSNWAKASVFQRAFSEVFFLAGSYTVHS